MTQKVASMQYINQNARLNKDVLQNGENSREVGVEMLSEYGLSSPLLPLQKALSPAVMTLSAAEAGDGNRVLPTRTLRSERTQSDPI